ncbi:MAG: xanthine dehydrogenase family protein molybdopterin-binding subunit [Defluviicoccus sp.]|nr:xanthine dehydrogenase family protein molybdopterin-binding subunit [Defluviicoccus sp.]
MGEFAIGQPVSRLEDPRLLKGLGRYVDDLDLPGQAYAFILRSPHAHARIRAIDASAAQAMPGVLGVLTGADCEADGLGHLPCDQKRFRRDGGDMYRPPRPILACDRVRVVGDYVALVVAETAALARDAAERIAVDYQPLPAVVSPAAAGDPGAPQLWDGCPGNECFFHEDGDREAVEAGFASAHLVVERRFVISRVTAAPLGPRGCIGEYDLSLERYTLRTGVQQAHLLRMHLARTVLGIPETRMRVIAPDIGGSFGLYSNVYPENALVLWAAKKFARPVKWSAERGECMVSDDSARDCVSDAALALDRDGRFLALRCRSFANLGAYLSLRGPLPPVVNLGTLAGTYTTPAIHVRVSGMFTNTFCTSPYRGAGRPEASTVLEQLIDEAARRLRLDAAEIRRRNTIPADAMPYRTALTFTYDSGDFERNLDDALALAGYAGFAARREDAAARGKLRGIGISNTVHRAAGLEIEAAQIRFDASGTATLMVGSVHHGQGHATTFTQIACDRLGLEPGAVRFVSGDTDVVTFGRGSFASRSAALGGSAVALAADRIVDKGRIIAAALLEAAEEDIDFADGVFSVSGTDRSVGIADIARAAYAPRDLPLDIEPGLDEMAMFRPGALTFPNGCHVAEIEIDPETGAVEIAGYAVVDDFGTILNPLLLEGQIHGGLAQGIGQALMEDVAFDPATGQLLAGSFMDYCMPRADDLPSYVAAFNELPTAVNPVGVKGAGEAGAVGALPAMMNAVVDALAPLGVEHVQMPATPERIWRAIRTARDQKA